MENPFNGLGLLEYPVFDPNEQETFDSIEEGVQNNNNKIDDIIAALQKKKEEPEKQTTTQPATTQQVTQVAQKEEPVVTGSVVDKLVDFVSVFEGGKKFGGNLREKELTGYRLHDNAGNHKTFGYGLLYHPDGGFMDARKDSYTQAELENLYKKTLQKRVDKVNGWAKKNNVKLNDNQVAAIASACYNYGDGFLNKPIMKKVAANPNDPSIKNDWSHLSDAQSIRFPGLKKRRIAEANMYFA